MPTEPTAQGFDERAFTARLEAADAEELAKLLARPSLAEERALRTYFGDARYQRMHSLALRRGSTRGSGGAKGNVVVIHGIMGGELTVFSGEHGDRVWMRVLRILGGGIEQLRLADDGASDANRPFAVRATGILKNTYGEILLSLSERWNVKPFWFDWRKDVHHAARELDAKIGEWFGDKPAHIVAHSMGGLVARTFIKDYPKRWRGMRARNGQSGGRLIMLGTPNNGSYAIPPVIAGADGTVRKLALCDVRHSLPEVLEILNTFVGSYQMLPSPKVVPAAAKFYEAETYATLRTPLAVPQHHLETARKLHEWLEDVVEPERMIYIAGYNRPTLSGVKPGGWKMLDSLDAYEVTLAGDGRVPHVLGELSGVPMYYVDELHGDLPSNGKILAALDRLLETGETSLPTSIPDAARGPAAATRAHALAQVQADRDAEDEARIDQFIRRMQTRRADAALPPRIMADEQKIAQAMTRGFLRTPEADRTVTVERAQPDERDRTVRVTIRLINGKIQDTASFETDDIPVDAIAVGHYIGVKPMYAEGAIDEAISEALAERGLGSTSQNIEHRIITQYTQRGIIYGELAQPFFLNDPRTDTAARNRVIAVLGLGLPGRCGSPQLTVATRELCWSLGRMGRRHLATVLIGAGAGNLPHVEAVSAWIRGLEDATMNARETEEHHLERITIVEYDPQKALQIDDALRSHHCSVSPGRRGATPGGNGTGGLTLLYAPLAEERRAALRREAVKRGKARVEEEIEGKGGASARDANLAPTRLAVNLESEKYRFGAITATASIPERQITIDPKLVLQVNDQLVAAGDVFTQNERGCLLGHLLIPSDLRDQLEGRAPVVLMLDANTARIHWEMVAQRLTTESRSGSGGTSGVFSGMTKEEMWSECERTFLSLSRGLTRQLRTTFAPPPEPPPPARRRLRVLVIADPGIGGWHLPGAEEEGVAVADLCESYNALVGPDTGNTVDVVRLFGPREATRANVMGHLFLQSFDVLHFAGHCQYTAGDPSKSGWVFGDGELISANELTRVDRIPKFVFSNACESGITPEDAERRSDLLAPNFAEAFFARGVANFVCTAWPVDDLGAREFAATLYAGLLGIERASTGRAASAASAAMAAAVAAEGMAAAAGSASVDGGQPAPARSASSSDRASVTGPMLMHRAMRESRLAIARTSNGVLTWGAYQHYGDPNFRLFERKGEDPPEDRATKTRGAGRRGARKRSARKAGASRSSAAKGSSKGGSSKR
ncbi:MAG: CHAT domain-containing protein [Gemmatimonadaceae bacterium]